MRGLIKGDRVLHAQYGTGTLTDVNEYYHTVIDFDEHGAHKFVTNLWPSRRRGFPENKPSTSSSPR
jgi:hypothetical protein